MSRPRTTPRWPATGSSRSSGTRTERSPRAGTTRPTCCSAAAAGGRSSTSTIRTRRSRPPDRLLLREIRLLGPPHLAGERLEEGHEVGPILFAQVERFDLLRQPFVRTPALVVELHGLQQRDLAPVVHVGRALRDVPERRRLEGPAVGLDLGDPVPPPVGIRLVHADPEVVERLVGEVEARVAGDAVAPLLVVEERQDRK